MADAVPISGALNIKIGGHQLPVTYTGQYSIEQADGKDAVGFAGAITVLGSEMPWRTTILCDLPREADGAVHSSVSSVSIGRLLEASLLHRFESAESDT